MKYSILAAVSIIALAGCGNNSGEDSTVSASTNMPQAVTVSAPDTPSLQFFSSTDSAMAVVDGAGCGYTAPGVTGDSMLFAYATDGGMLVNGQTQILKMVSEGREELMNDSTDEMIFENAAYRVELRMVTDSMMEAGVSQHGEITVEDKQSGTKTTVAIEGGCGC